MFDPIQDVMPLDVAAKLKHRFHSSLDSAAHLAHFKIHPVHTAPQLESDNAFITVASDLTSPTYAPPSAFCDIASAVLGLGALLSLEHTEQVLSFSESVQGQAQTLAPRLLSGSKSLPARFLPPGEAVATSHLRHQPAQMGVVYSSWHENVCVLFADIVGWVAGSDGGRIIFQTLKCQVVECPQAPNWKFLLGWHQSQTIFGKSDMF